MPNLQQYLLGNELDLNYKSKVSLDEENVKQSNFVSPLGNENQPTIPFSWRENDPNSHKDEEARKPQYGEYECDNKEVVENGPFTRGRKVKRRSILKNSLSEPLSTPIKSSRKERRGSSVTFSNVFQVHQLETWYYQAEYQTASKQKTNAFVLFFKGYGALVKKTGINS